MLIVNKICKKYQGKTILEDVSFTAKAGEVISILGLNGSGKSTLLSIIAGMQKPDHGTIDLNGEAMGFVPQDDFLFEDLTVRDNIRFWAAASGIKRKEPDENKYLKLLEVMQFQDKKVRVLSGGMRRRAAIGIALLPDPNLLILDEPFTGLDLYFKQEIIAALGSLSKLGKSIVYTTHSADEITGLSNKIFIIKNGRLLCPDSAQFLSADSLTYQHEEFNRLLLQLIKGNESE